MENLIRLHYVNDLEAPVTVPGVLADGPWTGPLSLVVILWASIICLYLETGLQRRGDRGSSREGE